MSKLYYRKENGILVSLTVFRLGCVEVPAMQTGTLAEKIRRVNYAVEAVSFMACLVY